MSNHVSNHTNCPVPMKLTCWRWSSIYCIAIETSWYGNAFCISDPLWGKSTGHFPHKGPVLRSFEGSLLSSWTRWRVKLSSCWWFETPWSVCDVAEMGYVFVRFLVFKKGEMILELLIDALRLLIHPGDTETNFTILRNCCCDKWLLLFCASPLTYGGLICVIFVVAWSRRHANYRLVH